jgi:hypothetical protein
VRPAEVTYAYQRCPDGVLALLGVPVGLVAAGVDDLEVVDVAVGLVEVAVAVEVVPVVLVEALHVRLDLGGGAAGGLLVGDPLVGGVRDECPHVLAGAGVVDVAVAAVAGLVVLHLDPVGDLAVDAVAPGGLGLVVGLQ